MYIGLVFMHNAPLTVALLLLGILLTVSIYYLVGHKRLLKNRNQIKAIEEINKQAFIRCEQQLKAKCNDLPH